MYCEIAILSPAISVASVVTLDWIEHCAATGPHQALAPPNNATASPVLVGLDTAPHRL